MNLYLDDDSVEHLLVKLLRTAGHDVVIPIDVGHYGSDDPVHLAYAINVGRVLLTANSNDFENLHKLIESAHGRHEGILVVRTDNDPRRDMTARGIVVAIRNLEASGMEVANAFHILNHWRQRYGYSAAGFLNAAEKRQLKPGIASSPESSSSSCRRLGKPSAR